MCFRPATPGFLITLLATALLAVVSFGVPLLKSVYFLKASLAVDNEDGVIKLGTLGYCIELSNGTTCTSASVGYEFSESIRTIKRPLPLSLYVCSGNADRLRSQTQTNYSATTSPSPRSPPSSSNGSPTLSSSTSSLSAAQASPPSSASSPTSAK